MLAIIATIGLVLFGIWGIVLLAYLASKIGKE